MATATPPRSTVVPASDGAFLVGQMVHYREGAHCWAAAIVDSAPGGDAQLFLLPLPPSFPMPSAPGTFVEHDAARGEETWHRLAECQDAPAPPARPAARRTRRSRG